MGNLTHLTKLGQTWQNLAKLDKNLAKYYQTWPNMTKLSQIWPNLATAKLPAFTSITHFIAAWAWDDSERDRVIARLANISGNHRLASFTNAKLETSTITACFHSANTYPRRMREAEIRNTFGVQTDYRITHQGHFRCFPHLNHDLGSFLVKSIPPNNITCRPGVAWYI